MIPQPGDLILVKGDGLVNTLIEFAENGIYSHVAIYCGNGQILEANWNHTIGYRPLSDYDGMYDIGHIKSTSVRREMVLKSAQSKIGQGYGWKLILLFILKLFFHINKPYDKHYGIVCSNYVVDSWKDAGVILTKNDKPTPQDVADSALVEIVKVT